MAALTALEDAGYGESWGRAIGLYRIIDRYGRTGLIRLGGATTGQGVDGLLAAWQTRLCGSPSVAAVLRDHPGTDGLALTVEHGQIRMVYGRSVAGGEYLVTRRRGGAPAVTGGPEALAEHDPAGLIRSGMATLLDLIGPGALAGAVTFRSRCAGFR